MRIPIVVLTVVCCAISSSNGSSISGISAELTEQPRRTVSSNAREKFKEMSGNINHLQSRLDFLHNPAYKDHHKYRSDELLDIVKHASHNPLKLAEYLNDTLPDILLMAKEDGVYCSLKSLIDARNNLVGLFFTLYHVASKVSELERAAGLISSDQSEPVRHIMDSVILDFMRHIENYENRCWDKSRIEALITNAVERDRRGNMTKRAAEIVESLSKWHTKDKFVVIARAKGCDEACSFEEEFRLEDDRVVSFRGVTVVRTRTSISSEGKTKLKHLVQNKAKKRTNTNCKDGGRFFIENLKTLGYMAINDEKCSMAVRSTHPDTVFTTDLTFDDVSGKKKQFRATMVFKCYRDEIAADGSFIPVCNI